MRQGGRRDAWLAKVADDTALKAARLMTMIELLVDDHQPEAALDAVRELSASGTRHLHALQWSLKAHQQAKNWPEVLRLVRILDKRHALHPALSSRLRELAYEDLLSDRSHDAESVLRLWSTIPSLDRVQPYVAVRAASALSARGLHDQARLVVEEALAVNWDERLVLAYRKASAAPGSPALLAQIEHCEAWNKQRPTDAELALTLGTLCLKQKLWGKAQRYLEQSLSDASEAQMVGQAHLQLAQLHDALAQPEEAAFHYRLCALATIL
jgi:HemY protein